VCLWAARLPSRFDVNNLRDSMWSKTTRANFELAGSVLGVGGPEGFGGFDGVAEFSDVGGGAFEEFEAVGEPAGEAGLGEVIENVAALAAFLDKAVRTEEAEVLGDSGVGDAEDGLERVDVALAVAKLLNNADAVRVREHTEEFRKFFGDNGSSGHARNDDTRD
jgi:hypothetical protein